MEIFQKLTEVYKSNNYTILKAPLLYFYIGIGLILLIFAINRYLRSLKTKQLSESNNRPSDTVGNEDANGNEVSTPKSVNQFLRNLESKGVPIRLDFYYPIRDDVQTNPQEVVEEIEIDPFNSKEDNVSLFDNIEKEQDFENQNSESINQEVLMENIPEQNLEQLFDQLENELDDAYNSLKAAYVTKNLEDKVKNELLNLFTNCGCIKYKISVYRSKTTVLNSELIDLINVAKALINDANSMLKK